jgi:hypothetical protein
MRSHTILAVARIGAERIAPGTRHNQNQNTNEKTKLLAGVNGDLALIQRNPARATSPLSR